VSTLRNELDQQIGEVQLPEAILEVDAQVRFSWIMLGREPRSAAELLMAYAGILAHGTSLTAAECARMIPQLSATSVRQAMRWAGDERRLRLACQAVLEYMQSHPIAATWGRASDHERVIFGHLEVLTEFPASMALWVAPRALGERARSPTGAGGDRVRRHEAAVVCRGVDRTLVRESS
jgi:hypothetical protein